MLNAFVIVEAWEEEEEEDVEDNAVDKEALALIILGTRSTLTFSTHLYTLKKFKGGPHSKN